MCDEQHQNLCVCLSVIYFKYVYTKIIFKLTYYQSQTVYAWLGLDNIFEVSSDYFYRNYNKEKLTKLFQKYKYANNSFEIFVETMLNKTDIKFNIASESDEQLTLS